MLRKMIFSALVLGLLLGLSFAAHAPARALADCPSDHRVNCGSMGSDRDRDDHDQNPCLSNARIVEPNGAVVVITRFGQTIVCSPPTVSPCALGLVSPVCAPIPCPNGLSYNGVQYNGVYGLSYNGQYVNNGIQYVNGVPVYNNGNCLPPPVTYVPPTVTYTPPAPPAPPAPPVQVVQVPAPAPQVIQVAPRRAVIAAPNTGDGGCLAAGAVCN